MKIERAIRELEGNATNVRFTRLVTICTAFWGSPRVKGGHHVFATGWAEPAILNVQNDDGKAKPYQVEQVLAALKRLQGEAEQ